MNNSAVVYIHVVKWERTVMKHKLQSNDFLKNKKKKKEKKKLMRKKDPSGLLSLVCV